MTAARLQLATRLAALLLGGVLLVAGLLKASASFAVLYHFGGAPPERAGKAALLTLATLEIVVAIILTQRPFSIRAWHIAIVMFCTFFVVAIVEANAGRQVCDCFGALTLRPHYIAVFDLLAACICVGAIMYLRHAGLDRVRRSFNRSLSASIAAFVLTLGGLLLVRESHLGDLRYGIPPVVAELEVDQHSADGPWISGAALLASRGGQVVRVVGCVQSCGLKINRALPFEIQPTAFTRLPMMIRRPSHAQRGLVPLTLFVEVRGSLEKLTLPLLTPRL